MDKILEHHGYVRREILCFETRDTGIRQTMKFVCTNHLVHEKRVLSECYWFMWLKALDQTNDAKVKGNKLFGDGKYEEVLLQYELALQVAPDMPSSVEIRSICHSNSGGCFLKLVWSSLSCWWD